MSGSGGTRLSWTDLPSTVRDGVADVLRSPVVEARSQTGGFSPGSADRVVTATGERAFVKAVSAAQNPDSPGMHRREARITGALPPGLPVPQLRGTVDVDGWIALVLTDVDGRTPALPWRHDELAAVLHALEVINHAATPCPLSELPVARDALAEDLAGFDRLAADGASIPGLDGLRDLADRGVKALVGDTLVHTDLRADNVLITAEGAVLVDWPWACRGPGWLDTLTVLVEVDRYGGHDTDELLRTTPATRDADPEDLTAVLAGFAGFFLDMARRDPPPGIPRLREFQRAQGEALLTWVRRRQRD
ncbi:phosphotransferase family protein [Pseudonocardia sp. CA-142604]|uniref:phosphotransferase family protein n=1 Tax=Pseudonocardia sp. CA-142604 TaxID=3240024 RepID=UPI003D8CB835